MHALIITYTIYAVDIAWDWVNRKLYWTEYCIHHIYVYDETNNAKIALIDTGSGTEPRGIIVDPTTR